MSRPRAPAGLSAPAGRFWRTCVAAYTFNPDELVLLVEVVRTMTAIDQLEQVWAAEGPMAAGSTGQPVEHPAGAALRGHRAVLSRLVRQLALPDPAAASEPDHPAWSQQRRAAQARWAGRRAGRA